MNRTEWLRTLIQQVIPIEHPTQLSSNYIRQVLPDTSANLILLYQGQSSNSLLRLSGPLTHKKLIPFSTHCQGMVVKLEPWSLGCLANMSAQELTNQSLALQDIMVPSSFERLQEQLASSPGNVVTLLGCLADGLVTKVVDTSLIKIINSIQTLNGQASVKALANELNTCTRHFERRFKAQTGLNPKQFLRTVRFGYAKTLLRQGYLLLDVTYQCGYFDQTHFTHEFKRMSGLPPHTFQRDELSLFY